MVTSSPVEKADKFYAEQYCRLGHWILKPEKKIFLGDKRDHRCRFCGKRPPEATFRKDAHAIPESLGNKSLFTYYECDACNELFGYSIENDFGNWSKPMRTLSRIRGKNGVPTIKRTPLGWRIEGDPHGLTVKKGDAGNVVEVDEKKKKVKITIPIDPYTPVLVLKTFVKMGLTLLPEEEVANVRSALQWVRTQNHNPGLVFKWPIIYTFFPGSYDGDIIIVFVFRRKHDDVDIPYAFLVLCYGNAMYQVFLPAPEREQQIHGKLKIPRFHGPLDFQSSPVGIPDVTLLDLTGTTRVVNAVAVSSVAYDGSVRVPRKGSET
jgi:hypothetical protein